MKEESSAAFIKPLLSSDMKQLRKPHKVSSLHASTTAPMCVGCTLTSVLDGS
jgi:hypothetical protein